MKQPWPRRGLLILWDFHYAPFSWCTSAAWKLPFSWKHPKVLWGWGAGGIERTHYVWVCQWCKRPCFYLAIILYFFHRRFSTKCLWEADVINMSSWEESDYDYFIADGQCHCWSVQPFDFFYVAEWCQYIQIAFLSGAIWRG